MFLCGSDKIPVCTGLFEPFLVSKLIYEPQHEISNNVVCVTSKDSDQPAHTHSLIGAFASRLTILLLLSYWPNSIWSF